MDIKIKIGDNVWAKAEKLASEFDVDPKEAFARMAIRSFAEDQAHFKVYGRRSPEVKYSRLFRKEDRENGKLRPHDEVFDELKGEFIEIMKREEKEQENKLDSLKKGVSFSKKEKQYFLNRNKDKK